VAEFEKAGVAAVHIDAYTEPEVRQEIYKRHNAGEFKILSCSSLLNTGYDSPSTRCIIDCYPTKSIIRYVQRVGRICRISEGKECAIYLDHASNVCRHGFAEDIVPDCLHDGEKEYQEEKQVKKDEKKEPIVCECCSAIMVAGKCGVCGHEIKRKKAQLEVVAGELQEVKEIDQAFYSGLLHHARQKGYADGWAKHKYREKFGVFPTGAKNEPSPDIRVAGYIKHLNIKRAKSSQKNKTQAEKTLKTLMEQFDV
jgi:superfamily II DNA or RNA helicase